MSRRHALIVTLNIVAILAMCYGIVIADPFAPAMAESKGSALSAQKFESSPPVVGEIVFDEPREEEGQQAEIAKRMREAMYRMAPVRVHTANGEKEESVHLRYMNFADAVAQIVLDPSEKPIAPPPDAREKTGLRILAQGFVESSFSDYVLDGRCNDRKWRMLPLAQSTLRRGGCDNGNAFGMAQLHVNQNGGIVLTDEGWTSGDEAKKRSPGVVPIMGQNMIESVALYVRVELHCLRVSSSMWGSRERAIETADWAYAISRQKKE